MKIRRPSDFHQIVVHESGGVRTLQFGSTVQSSLRLNDPAASGLDYVDFFHVPFLLRKSIEKVLFVGLGAGSGPRQFLLDYSDVRIDVVEIDPAVVRVAKEHFEFEESSRCSVHEDDGLSFLERTRRRYGLIVVDAYMTERGRLVIPSELITPAFFELCRKRLLSGGIVLFNCAAPADDALSREILEALRDSFAHTLVFELDSCDNTVLLASDEWMETRSTYLAERARRARREGRLGRDLVRRCRLVRRDLSR